MYKEEIYAVFIDRNLNSVFSDRKCYTSDGFMNYCYLSEFLISGETLMANKKREKTDEGKDAPMSQNELFQLEWDKGSKQWMFRSVRDKYWSYSETDGLLTMITANENRRCVIDFSIKGFVQGPCKY